MRNQLRSLVSPSMFVALLALIIAMSTASVAAVMINGNQIKKNTVTTAQIKNKTIKTKDMSPKARAQLKGQTGEPGTPGGPAGPAGPAGPTGPAGVAGPAGSARGYAYVKGSFVDRQSGGITATVASLGTTCVAIPGANGRTSAFVVTPDYASDSTSDSEQAYVEATSVPVAYGCGPSEFGVRTFNRNTASGVRTNSSEGFFIVVP